jgi:hypothetical protein
MNPPTGQKSLRLAIFKPNSDELRMRLRKPSLTFKLTGALVR